MSRRLHSPELAGIEVPGMTRSAFILRGTLAAAAAYGAGAAEPFVANALAQTAAGDVAILNFAYSLEQLEAAFYAAALKNAKLAAATKKLATEFSSHEQAHVAALGGAIQALGGNPGAAPKAKFAVKDEKAFLKLGVALEEVGISAYNGAAPSIQSSDLLATAGSIVQIEARHAAALHVTAGQAPSPNAFDKPLTSAQVTAAIKPFTGR